MWNDILLLLLPNQKCIAVNVTKKKQKLQLLDKCAPHCALFLYRPYGTSFHCSEIYEKFGDKLTAVYMKDLLCGDDIIQEVVRLCPNLKQLAVHGCWWVGQLKIHSKSLLNLSVDVPYSATQVSVRGKALQLLNFGHSDMMPCSSTPPILKLSIKANSYLKLDIQHIKRNVELIIENSKKTNLNVSNCDCDTFFLRSSSLDHLIFYRNQVNVEMKLKISYVKVIRILRSIRLKKLDMRQAKVAQLNYDINVKSAQVIF